MNSKKTLLIAAAAGLIVLLLLFGGRIFNQGGKAQPSSDDPSAIDVTREPVQESAAGEPAVFINFKDAILKVKPAASYRISGLVMGKHAYPGGVFGCDESGTWGDRISPYDFLMVWGDVTKPENLRHIRFSQGGRWYHYHYDAKSPLNQDDIGRHSSNNHFIPANQNVRYAADEVRVGEAVTLDGYLVNIEGTCRGSDVWWNSSLARDDTGAHSCEVFYVTRIKRNGKLYE